MIKKFLLTFSLFMIVGFAYGAQQVSAHPGRTDARGGHYCRTNCAKWGLADGEYHYPNGGGPSTSTPKPASVPASTPRPTLAPKSTPTPAPTLVPTPVPAPKKTIETVKSLVKESREKHVLLIDVLLLEAGKGKTSENYTTINAQKIAKTRISEATSEPKVVNDQELYVVSSVTDGDTIKVVINGKIEKVRLLGIDTPETKDPRKPVQCFGKEASSYAKSMLEGQHVRLEMDPSQGDKDRYGRLLRYVYLEDGTDMGTRLVENGYAVAYVRYPVSKMETYKALQKKAEEDSVGLWSACR